jgi:excisionase family DNA binding protein
MGQQMMAAMGAAQTTPAVAGVGAPPPLPGAGALPELLGISDVANALGVSEADVVSTLEAGDLKGKKIGSTWRITRAALDEFLRS